MRTAIAEMERGKRGAAGVSQQRNASQKGYTIVELSIAVAMKRKNDEAKYRDYWKE